MEPGSEIILMIDPQFQRRLLAASGFAELSLFQEAVEELEDLPEASKDLPPVLVVWLEVYQRWQKWSEAESVATRLLEMEPEEPSWLVALAYATRRNRGLIFAREILFRAAEQHPNCGTIQFNLACYAAQLGQLEEARQRLHRAIQIDKAFAAMAKSDPDLEAIRDEIEID
jgi:lipopolysaccharide biosynthesis regulator YciM